MMVFGMYTLVELFIIIKVMLVIESRENDVTLITSHVISF